MSIDMRLYFIEIPLLINGACYLKCGVIREFSGMYAMSIHVRDAREYDGYRFGIENSGTNSRPSRFATSLFSARKLEFRDRFGTESMKTFTIGAANRMAQTTQKNIRFTFEEWKRVEKEAEIHLLRSVMFTAQAIIRDMERDRREEEIEQISRNISEVAPELPGR